eukprot:RCo009887
MFRSSGGPLRIVKVVMRRVFKPKTLGKEGFDALIKMKQLTVTHPGFLSSEVNVNVEDYHDQLIITTWNKLEDWLSYRESPARMELYNKVTSSFAQPEVVKVYTPTSASRNQNNLEEQIKNLRGSSVGDKYTKRRLDD